MTRPELIKRSRITARAILVAIALFWLGFSILSGAQGGIIANLPNAAPWAVLCIVVYIAFRWERLGGALVLAAGVGSLFFFKAWNSPVVLIGVPIPLMAAGGVLIACHYLQRHEPQP